MGLKGSLKTLPLQALLNVFSAIRSTGLLEVTFAGVRRSIYLEEGRLISADSSDPKELLGHFLLSHGKITEDQLHQAMALKQKTGGMLGKTLVSIGALTETAMAELLVLKCKELLFGAFFWPEADFEFYDNTPPPIRLIPTSLELPLLIEEGVRRQHEYATLRKMYPTRGVCFEKIQKENMVPKFTDPFVSSVYDLVDGKRTVREIILQSHSSEYRVFKCLHLLAQKGLLRVLDPNKEPSEVADRRVMSQEMMQLAKTNLSMGRLEEAMNLFRFMLKQNPDNKEAKDLLASTEESIVRNIAEAVPQDAIFTMSRSIQDLAQEKLTSEESFVLSRINGQWDVKTILTVTPLPEIEVLRIFKRLLDRNIIRIV